MFGLMNQSVDVKKSSLYHSRLLPDRTDDEAAPEIVQNEPKAHSVFDSFPPGESI